MTTNSPHFKMSFEPIDDSTGIVYLEGYMDENCSMDESLIQSHLTEITFDFDKIVMVNSIGIKYWMHLMAKLSNRLHLKIKFRNCRKPIVDSVNFVSGFRPPRSIIESFYIPLYCQKCDRVFDILRTPDNSEDPLDQMLDDVHDQIDCSEFPQCKVEFELDFDRISYTKRLY